MSKNRKNTTKECPFCSRKELSAQILYATPNWVVIVSRRPLSKGHLIFFPRRHVTHPGNLTAVESRSLFQLMKKASGRIKARFGSSGFQILMNLGKQSGQAIDHIHFHLIPRYSTEKNSPLKPLVSRSAYHKLTKLSSASTQALVKKLRA